MFLVYFFFFRDLCFSVSVGGRGSKFHKSQSTNLEGFYVDQTLLPAICNFQFPWLWAASHPFPLTSLSLSNAQSPLYNRKLSSVHFTLDSLHIIIVYYWLKSFLTSLTSTIYLWHGHVSLKKAPDDPSPQPWVATSHLHFSSRGPRPQGAEISPHRYTLSKFLTLRFHNDVVVVVSNKVWNGLLCSKTTDSACPLPTNACLLSILHSCAEAGNHFTSLGEHQYALPPFCVLLN